MTYNIHPILVHFPIALLFIYSIIKIIPFQKYFQKISWKQIELTFLLLGVSTSLLASSTGEIAEHLVRNAHNRQLIEVHSLFATISIWLYGLLLFGEFLSLLNNFISLKIKIQRINVLLLFVQKILTQHLLSKIIAFLGLIAIIITGLLGGIIIYGVYADPIAPVILKILGINY